MALYELDAGTLYYMRPSNMRQGKPGSALDPFYWAYLGGTAADGAVLESISSFERVLVFKSQAEAIKLIDQELDSVARVTIMDKRSRWAS